MPERVEVGSEGSTHEIFPPEKRQLANEYKEVAAGASMPLRIHYEDYSANVLKHLKPRTIDDDHRAIDTFERWCTKRHIKQDLREITTKVAKRFADELGTFEGNIEPITCSKYIGRLRQYWERIVYLETVPSNPWLAVKIRIPETKHEERERPFTDDEVRRLLTGECLQHLKDLMYIGALTGARLDTIVDLKVKHALEGHFTFKKQKLEKSSRDVPIHSALKEIVARRTVGKDPEAWFFPEYPPPKKGSIKEHSSTATKAFTIYRRRLKVDDVVEGKRRALVNFHSFRRWFITKAERAGQKDTIIAAVVGHTREGITLSKYSAGPEMRQAKRVVESVKLPPLDQSYVPEPRAITPRRR